MTRTLPTMSPTGPSTGCTSANGSANAVVSSATAFGSTWMSCAIGGMIGSVAREASAVMKPIRLSRRIRLRVWRSSRLRRPERREPESPSSERAGIEFGLEIHGLRKAIHDFRRFVVQCGNGSPDNRVGQESRGILGDRAQILAHREPAGLARRDPGADAPRSSRQSAAASRPPGGRSPPRHRARRPGRSPRRRPRSRHWRPRANRAACARRNCRARRPSRRPRNRPAAGSGGAGTSPTSSGRMPLFERIAFHGGSSQRVGEPASEAPNCSRNIHSHG